MNRADHSVPVCEPGWVWPTGTCPWCGRQGDLILIMWFDKHYRLSERVCADCRRDWLDRLKREIGGLECLD